MRPTPTPKPLRSPCPVHATAPSGVLGTDVPLRGAARVDDQMTIIDPNPTCRTGYQTRPVSRENKKVGLPERDQSRAREGVHPEKERVIFCVHPK